MVHSPKQLADFADYVLYEAGMLARTARDLSDRADTVVIREEETIQNALMESFSIHLRGVLDFLYPTSNPRSDDVVAAQYVPDWPQTRPPIPFDMDIARQRCHKEIMHLTTMRLREIKLIWRFIPLAQMALEVFESFRSRTSSFGNFDRQRAYSEAIAALIAASKQPVVFGRPGFDFGGLDGLFRISPLG
jgi:hypothetical protein